MPENNVLPDQSKKTTTDRESLIVFSAGDPITMIADPDPCELREAIQSEIQQTRIEDGQSATRSALVNRFTICACDGTTMGLL